MGMQDEVGIADECKMICLIVARAGMGRQDEVFVCKQGQMRLTLVSIHT